MEKRSEGENRIGLLREEEREVMEKKQWTKKLRREEI